MVGDFDHFGRIDRIYFYLIITIHQGLLFSLKIPNVLIKYQWAFK